MSTNETELKIRTLGDAVLRKKTRRVTAVTEEHRRLLSRMARVMYAIKGIGLAANQVGICESLAVVDSGTGLYKIINPKIIRKEGTQMLEEGCLSIPGATVKVKRAAKVTVRAWDENGKPITINADNLLACIFQHEIDHLNGKLIIDHAHA